MKKLSVIAPAFNEESCIAKFAQAVFALGIENPLEIVFVDDGSSDSTIAEIKTLADRDERIRYVSFSRNFGKEAALLAGLAHATGDIAVTMDVDLQHDPALLPAMLEAIEKEGFDCAAARRTTWSGESFSRGWFARRFYAVMRSFSDVDLKDGSMDFRMMTRQVVDAVLSLKERDRFSKGIYQWVGFRTKWFDCPNSPRAAGVSKWSLRSLFAYSIRGILAFSTAPLHIATFAGAVSCIAAIGWIAYLAVMWAAFSAVPSSCSIIVAVFALLGGFQLLATGVLGLYLAALFREAKRRPAYIVREAR